jgi:hypothetical protein
MAPSGIDRVPAALKDDFITIGWSLARAVLTEPDWWKFREEIKRIYYQDQNYRRAGQAAGDPAIYSRNEDWGLGRSSAR